MNRDRHLRPHKYNLPHTYDIFQILSSTNQNLATTISHDHSKTIKKLYHKHLLISYVDEPPKLDCLMNHLEKVYLLFLHDYQVKTCPIMVSYRNLVPYKI